MAAKSKKLIKKEMEWGGRTLSFEYGELAGQANGSVLARYGDTVVLATATSAKAKEDIGYFPLFVEYVERLYAGGIIKGSRFVKREGRPSDEAILSGRIIDRIIRPLFPENYKDEVQVVTTVLSVDGESDPTVLGVCAASAALMCSDIPWEGPAAAVQVAHASSGEAGHNLVVNPARAELESSDIDLTVGGTKDAVVMVEGGAHEIPEKHILEAIEFGQKSLLPVTKLIQDLADAVAIKKQEIADDEMAKHVLEDVREFALKPMKELFEKATSKDEMNTQTAEIEEKIYKKYEGTYQKVAMANALNEITKEAVRELIIKDGKRTDGRKMDEVRPLAVRVGILPRTHGSAIFQRGETQVLTIVTLGSTSLEQIIEGPLGEVTKRYMHHYNFPPYSVGEVGRMIGPGRREIGHSALAERALDRMIPAEDQFPYTIRLVSEVLSSNGSTSMASTCGSTLALMDAGVPIKAPVSGIAMGLFTDGKTVRVLTDIAGLEDHYGDMDFKVAGTETGVTAVQMDLKVKGISHAVMTEALEHARKARLHILEAMIKVIGKPRKELSKYAPKVTTVKIPVDKIGTVIGPGGRMIREITEKTGAAIDIEEDGTVTITAKEEESLIAARKFVEDLTREVEVGEVFEGEVKRLMDFGAFVEVLPGKEGLVHVSQLSYDYVGKPGDVVKVGDKIKVKVIEIDDQGRINLSKKALEKAPEGYVERRDFDRPRPPRGDRGERGGGGFRSGSRSRFGSRSEGRGGFRPR
ncbi:MAG: polyribonucleotide nucleotidyltransferase [Patescibacteria group bacterium]